MYAHSMVGLVLKLYSGTVNTITDSMRSSSSNAVRKLCMFMLK